MARENSYRVNDILSDTSSYIGGIDEELKMVELFITLRDVEGWAKILMGQNEIALKLGFSSTEIRTDSIRADLMKIEERFGRFIAQRENSAAQWRLARLRCIEKEDEELSEIANIFLDGAEGYEFEIIMFRNEYLNYINQKYEQQRAFIDSVHDKVKQKNSK